MLHYLIDFLAGVANMIIGNGMMANAMQTIDSDDYLFFCSGVSNSKETDESAFLKEQKLLSSYLNTDQCLVYFSSYFVNFDSYLSERYYRHKDEMERLIRTHCVQYKIFRAPQIVGHSSNPKTLTNFLYHAIKSATTLTVYTHAERNLMDIDDVATIVHYTNQHSLFLNETVNLISTHNSAIEEIIELLETITGIVAQKSYIPAPKQPIEVLLSKEMLSVYDKLNLNFGSNYLHNVLQKYYRQRSSS